MDKDYVSDSFVTQLSNIVDSIRRSIHAIIAIVLINVFIFVIGVIGNIITCLVIVFNKSMHTTTNFYLFNLAISDLLLLITGVPHEIFNNTVPLKVYLGRFGCLFNNWANETSADVSIMTITAFTIERYLAICHPFSINSMSKTSRVVKIVIFIWIIGLISGFLLASQFKFISIGFEEYAQCYFEEAYTHHVFQFMTLIFFILPMTILTVMYILMGLKLKKMRNDLNLDQNFRTTNSANTRTLKMLVIVVAAFFMCWAPFHVQRLMAVTLEFIDKGTILDFVYKTINDISGVLYMLSAAINPIIYSIMSIKFRNAAKEVFSRLYKKSPRITKSSPINENNEFKLVKGSAHKQ